MARYLVLTSFIEARREYNRDALLTTEDLSPWPAETRAQTIATLIATGRLVEVDVVAKGSSKGAAAGPAPAPAMPAGEGGLPPASAAPTVTE